VLSLLNLTPGVGSARPTRAPSVALTVAVILTAIASVTVTGCGGDDADPLLAPIVTALERGAEAIPEAGALACEEDRRVLATAIENYTLLESRAPDTEDDLVPDWLRAPSKLWDVEDGAIVPAAGSPCG